MLDNGIVVSVNISKEKGTIKQPVSQISLDCNGIVGDAHAGPWHRQVSLLGQEDIDFFVKEIKREISPGEFAENITVSGVDLGKDWPRDETRSSKAHAMMFNQNSQTVFDAATALEK